MRLRPTKNNILIEIHKRPSTTIALVDENESKIEQATVLAIGEEVTVVNEGDQIVFKSYEVDEIVIDTNKYTFITEEAIKGICTNIPTK